MAAGNSLSLSEPGSSIPSSRIPGRTTLSQANSECLLHLRGGVSQWEPFPNTSLHLIGYQGCRSLKGYSCSRTAIL